MPERDLQPPPRSSTTPDGQPRAYTSRWIALVYFVFGALWIFLTDQALIWFHVPPERVLRIQTSKGWLFVLLSSALLYALLSLLQRRNDAALRALSQSDAEIRRMNAELERRVAQRTEQLEATN